MDKLFEVVSDVIGIGGTLLMLGLAAGWVMDLFTGSGGSSSDFDTRDPGDYF